MIFISGVLATAQDSALWRYVNTLDGVNVRDKPSLSGKKKFALKCNERVELLEETRKKEKIGDSEKPWCKIHLGKKDDLREVDISYWQTDSGTDD